MTETTLENYQERAARTMPDLGSQAANGTHMALGVITETGEMNKGMIAEDLVNVKEEHGDTCWYLAGECNIYGFNFHQLYNIAIDHLKQQKIDLFSMEDYVDLHKREFAYGKEMNTDALFEQLLALMIALVLVAEEFGFSFEGSLATNIDKLYQRFPDKFSQEDAINRDLEKEREILEK